MKTKLLCTLAGAAFLFAVGRPAAWAESTAQTSTPPSNISNHTLPVLVKVGPHGRIIDMAPAFKLPSRYTRLLRKTLDAMITGPARDADGNAVLSTSIIYLTRKVTPRPDGKYTLQFAYVATQKLPNGRYRWRHTKGHRVTLVSRPFRSIILRTAAPYPAYPERSHSAPQAYSFRFGVPYSPHDHP